MPQDLEYKPKAPLKRFYYITIIFIIFLPIKLSDMTIMWSGTLVFLLARLKRKPYKVARIKRDEEERIKRLCIYYMCIDDLPL